MKLGRYQPAPGGFAGAVASAGETQPDDETVLTHGRRHFRGYSFGYFGGYRGYSSFAYGHRSYSGRSFYGWPGYGYGYGYRSFFGSPWYSGSGLSFSYYRPGFAISVYSAPRYYSSFYSPLYYSSFYSPRYCSYGFGYPAFAYGRYLPIGGTTAAAVTLDLPARPRVPLATDLDGQLRYDGGPASPVPLPSPDQLDPPQRIEPVREADSLPISLRKPGYRYPAYGDRK